MAIILNRNIEPERATSAFESAAMDLENRRGYGHDGKVLRDAYVQWVHVQYQMLREYVGTARAEELVHSSFYWHVLTMNTAEASAAGQLFQGMTSEAAKVREIATELKQLAAVLASIAGWKVAVVDTNALAMIQPPWQVNWSRLICAKNVRVLLPLRVIEELDKHKYGEVRQISEVARNLLPQIESKLRESNGTKAIVNDHLTIEIPILPGVRDRNLHADEEILRLCEEVKRFGNQDVTLVTNDTAMRIQARSRGLFAKGIDPEYRRRRSKAGADQTSTDSHCAV